MKRKLKRHCHSAKHKRMLVVESLQARIVLSADFHPGFDGGDFAQFGDRTDRPNNHPGGAFVAHGPAGRGEFGSSFHPSDRNDGFRSQRFGRDRNSHDGPMPIGPDRQDLLAPPAVPIANTARPAADRDRPAGALPKSPLSFVVSSPAAGQSSSANSATRETPAPRTPFLPVKATLSPAVSVSTARPASRALGPAAIEVAGLLTPSARASDIAVLGLKDHTFLKGETKSGSTMVRDLGAASGSTRSGASVDDVRDEDEGAEDDSDEGGLIEDLEPTFDAPDKGKSGHAASKQPRPTPKLDTRILDALESIWAEFSGELSGASADDDDAQLNEASDDEIAGQASATHEAGNTAEGGMIELAVAPPAFSSQGIVKQPVGQIGLTEIEMDAGLALFQGFELVTAAGELDERDAVEQPLEETEPGKGPTPNADQEPPPVAAASIGLAALAVRVSDKLQRQSPLQRGGSASRRQHS